MVRGKFILKSIIETAGQQGCELKLRAVCPENSEKTQENTLYHKYTPNGEISMYVDNPVAQAQFKLGEYYYVDFTPCKVE